MGIGDPSGQFVYLASNNPFQEIDRVIETYKLNGSADAPEFVKYVSFGYPSGMEFDPSGSQLLIGSGFGDEDGPNSETTECCSKLRAFSIGPDGVPIRSNLATISPRFGSSFGFKAGGAFVIWARTNSQAISNGGVHVYQRNCANGEMADKFSLSYDKGLRFLSVPHTGSFFYGYDCLGPTPGAQLFSFDTSSTTISAVPDGFIPGVCMLRADPQSEYLAAALHRTPTDQYSPWDIFVIYAFDLATGRIRETDRHMFPVEPNGVHLSPSAIAFDKTGRFVYLAQDGKIAAFQLDRTNGKLISISGAPFPVPVMFSPMFIVGRL